MWKKGSLHKRAIVENTKRILDKLFGRNNIKGYRKSGGAEKEREKERKKKTDLRPVSILHNL